MATPTPRHGTINRYRGGCRCDKCKAANATKKRKERERAKAAREAAAREAAETNVVQLREHLSVVHDDPHVPTPDAVQPFSVMVTLAEALEEITADDPVTRYRKSHALTLATVLDDPGKSYLWKSISDALATVLGHLIAKSEAGGASAVAEIMAAIRGT